MENNLEIVFSMMRILFRSDIQNVIHVTDILIL